MTPNQLNIPTLQLIWRFLSHQTDNFQMDISLFNLFIILLLLLLLWWIHILDLVSIEHLKLVLTITGKTERHLLLENLGFFEVLLHGWNVGVRCALVLFLEVVFLSFLLVFDQKLKCIYDLGFEIFKLFQILQNNISLLIWLFETLSFVNELFLHARISLRLVVTPIRIWWNQSWSIWDGFLILD